MSRKDKQITIARQMDVDYHGGGFFVIELGREQYLSNRAPMFSFTFSEYPSRRAWEMRNDNAMISGGSSDEIILKAAPELAWLLPLHGSWTDNGEPTHGGSNGWYWLAGGAADHEINYRRVNDGRKNMHEAPDDIRSEEWALFWLGLACNALRCELHELSVIDLSLPEAVAKMQFNTFVAEVLRPRWQAEADKANAWMDAYEGDHRPEEIRDEPMWEITFDNGLKLRATLDEHNEGTPDDRRYWYYVTISAPGVKPYKAKWGGSTADYDDGRVSAREAALGTAKGLFDFQFEGPEGYATSLGEDWDELPLATRRAFERASEAFDRFDHYLIPNQEVIG